MSRGAKRKRQGNLGCWYLGQRRPGLLEPEGHLHHAVHRGGRPKLALRLTAVADLLIQRAEAEMAVRHERAHPWFVGQQPGIAGVHFGLLYRGWAGLRDDVV